MDSELEVIRLRKRIEEMEINRLLKPLVDQFAENLCIIQVFTVPYSEWTPAQKHALDSAFKDNHDLKQLYLDRLSKK
jgi:hypothetical protein